ncbi:hypothetical protein BWQ96_08382 [Gracilariopsis chorda]|uniref:Uncharacterized protein n=1 Tax=Gracilariopsis chorda TaxID=448386 RepID=A0A2V3IL68_9FLOR|nr:hypothetical protein BWQ96_08382 [Gracilariopsis chorda]|eukprot:PXF41880.1 hypothetical protein BWQ96_08382 [Gracilariopsis chorda]
MKFIFALGLYVCLSEAVGASIGMGRETTIRYRPSVAPTPHYTATTTAPPTAQYAATQPSYATPTPPPEGYTAPETSAPTTDEKYTTETDNMCWMETKKCCYIEKADGYECKDYYAHKYARCYAKFKYVRRCDKAESHGKPEKPKPRVEKSKCQKVHYDQNYGPHVEGYPTDAESEWYDSEELPKKPYGVKGEPQYPAPRYEAEPVYANSGYETPPRY